MTELTLVPYADGRFEVVVDGDTIYSKLQTGEFPQDADMVDAIRARK